MTRLLVLVLLATRWVSVAASGGPAIANSAVSVDNVHLSQARVGEDSRLRLTIRNDSTEKLVLLGFEGVPASATRLMGRVSRSEWVEIGSVVIAADSSLDLSSSHLRIEIERVRVGLEPGAMLPVTLRFGRGTLPVPAHVMRDAGGAL